MNLFIHPATATVPGKAAILLYSTWSTYRKKFNNVVADAV
jgi:hypothetical protein